MDNNKLKIENLSVIYENGDGVRNIDMTLKEGEILTILGPSGCGKSTLLRVIGGFNKVTGGKIYIDGKDYTNLSPEKRPTSMVFQQYNLWPHMTVYENMAFGLKLRKINKNEIKKNIHDILELLKMKGMENKYPNEMSGGQQQRIAIGRSLLLKPSVLLLDEPFSALDAKIRQQMREELVRIQSELNISVVFVTHDQEEAMAISDRIVVMSKGSIAQVGAPKDIYDNPVNPYVASFIGEMNFINNEENNNVIAFRPEEIKLYQDNSGEYKGIIEQIMLRGHYLQLKLVTEKGVFKAYIPKNDLNDLKEKVKISFDITIKREYTKSE